MREHFKASREMARNFPYLIATCDDSDRADNHGGSSDFEVQPKISVIRPKSLPDKITDTLPLTLLQSLANGYMNSILVICVALRYRGIFCDVDLAFRQFAMKRDACLSRELVWSGGQLNKLFVALGSVILSKLLNLHRRDISASISKRRDRPLLHPPLSDFL